LRKYPVRFHEKNGGYYYVYQNKWEFLSRDYAEALQTYAAKMNKKDGSLAGFIERGYQTRNLANGTLKAYRIAAEKLKIAFAEFNPDDLRPAHFYQYIKVKQITPSMAQLYRSVMIHAMELAIEEGVIDSNPMKAVKNWRGGRREKYIENTEFLTIREHARPMMQTIMDIAVQTGQRICDVLKITYADIRPEGIYVEQKKSQGKTKVFISWTADLKESIETARAMHASIKGMTLFSNRKGQPLPYSTVRDWWIEATTNAGLDYHEVHIHDIRAKTATDSGEQGLDSKSLLGHRTDEAHDRYQRSKKIKTVTPIPAVKS